MYLLFDLVLFFVANALILILDLLQPLLLLQISLFFVDQSSCFSYIETELPSSQS